MDVLASAPSCAATDLGSLLGDSGGGAPAVDPRVRKQQALVAFGRRTNAQPSLDVLMQDAVALVCEILGAELGGIGVVEGETLAMTIVACGETPSPAQVHRCPLGDTASMAAYALRTGSLTVSPDIRGERRFCDLLLKELGVAGAMGIPLHLGGRPFGALGIYTRQAREFTLDDVAFAETIAHLLGASIARIRVEQKLEESNAINSGVLDMVDAMVMTLDLDGCVVDMNRSCEALTQYRADEIRHKPVWSVLSSPEDAELLKAIFRGARTKQVPNEFDGCILAKDGTRRRVLWSLKVLCTGEVQTILMTGTDHTARAQTKVELDRIKSLTEQTTATVAQLCTRLAEPVRPAPAPRPAPLLAVEATAAVDIPLSEQSGAELRRSFRREYRYRQSIAPMEHGAMPSRREFFEVDCRDISASGLAFVLDHAPNFESLVVALGRPPAVKHFTARVMRVAQMEEDGRTRYLVGCRFQGRVQV